MAKIIIENNDNNSIPVRYTYDNIPSVRHLSAKVSRIQS